MALSKRVRFEILRRDDHACHYCGARSPHVTLTVDHVIPVALGGSDDPTNLVTACSGCNAGKASINLDDNPVDEISALALRWADAVCVAAESRRRKHAEVKKQLDRFDESWQSWHPRGSPEIVVERDAAWRLSIERFLMCGLGIEDLEYFIPRAMTFNMVKPSYAGRWKYFCGCCWRHLQSVQEEAFEMLEREDQEREMERKLSFLEPDVMPDDVWEVDRLGVCSSQQ